MKCRMATFSNRTYLRTVFGSMMSDVKNIFTDIPENLRNELIEPLLQTANARMERIISKGHCSPIGFWYDQDDNEWVILLQGSAGLRFEEGKKLVVLNPGDYFHIDRHQKHRVEWTDPDKETIWLALHYR